MFVAVSLNLTRILSLRGMADRALVALSLLLAILVISSILLIPGQPPFLLGLEVLLVSILLAGLGARAAVKSVGHTEPERRGTTFTNLVLLEVAVLPYVAGAIVILAGELKSGLYCIAAGIILSFVKAVLDAWVLLVEINR